MAIRDHLSVNIEIRPEDMMDAPEFSWARRHRAGRGRYSARGLPALLDELTETLVA
jgi:type I restriction enzyme, R subunit